MSDADLTEAPEPAVAPADLGSILSSLPVTDASEEDRLLRFAKDVDHGLSASSRFLDCRYLYDEHGSELFENICEQPEYYPTRTEESILRRHARNIAEETGQVTLVELGAGVSSKTRHLLRAYCTSEARARYVAVDVSESALEKGEQSITKELPDVEFHAVCTTYEHSFPILPHLGKTMLVFLGSTAGNFSEREFSSFFACAAAHLTRGDYLLLGIDLHKDTKTLEAAYNDAAGVSAAFTRNLFARINRELGAEIDLDAIAHRAHYNARDQQIEICAEFLSDQEIHIAPLGVRHQIAAGERIHTELSRKFSLSPLRKGLAEIGLCPVRVFTDSRDWFAVLLLEPR